MRLVKLYANMSSFKPVIFDATGLTLIVGSKSRKGGTYNGVGKSLIIELLHFCLGSKKIQSSKKIPMWEFSLDFEINGTTHHISRNTSRQEIVYLDHQETKIAALNQWLEERAFSVPPGVPGLTFRGLINKFLRRGQKHYNDPRETEDYTDYDMLVRNCFLLGVDVELVAMKAALRKKVLELKTLRKNFKDDPLLQDFYSGGKDPDIQLNHLNKQIASLENDRDSFVVAENYYELQKEADELASGIEMQKNGVFLARHAVSNIERSMFEQPDLPLQRVVGLYGEIAKAFKPESLKHLEQVSDFHTRLLKNRVARLSKDKLRLLSEIESLEGEIKTAQIQLDDRLRILGNTAALDQYTAIVSELANLVADAQKLHDYKEIEVQYSNRAADLDGKLSTEVKKTNVYLEETKSERDKNFSVFEDYVARFYPNTPAGITLHNNEGDNQKRFDLQVRVENDSSDGINEARIFAMT